MADDNKKSPEEASNLFHNIMKASVKVAHPRGSGIEKCPECGAKSEFVSVVSNDDEKDTVTTTFKCPNGHIYELILPRK